MWVSHLHLLLLWSLWLHSRHHFLAGGEGGPGQALSAGAAAGHSWGCGGFSKVLQNCSSLSLSPSSLSGLARNHEALDLHRVALRRSVCKC